MRFRGKFIVEVDAPTDDIPRLSKDLLAALRFAATDAPAVLKVEAAPYGTQEVIVTFTMESDGTEELDDIVDAVFSRAMHTLSDDEDEITVVESGLVPA